jgi:thioredoxin-related protein
LHASLLAAALALTTLAPASHAAEINWREWNAGLAEAAASKRPVVVDVYTDWCGWCKRMDKDVYAREDVRDYLARNYVTIRLNAEASGPAKYENRNYTSSSLAQRFRVSGYPTTIFLRANGEHLVNVPGYIDADRFKLMLRYFGEGHYDRGVQWEDFAKNPAAPAAGH